MTTQYIPIAPTLVISLDFELMWGVFDKRTLSDYGDNVQGVHEVIPRMLALFEEYGVHATWATVGCLFYENLKNLQLDIPSEIPVYLNDKFSAYSHLKNIDPKDFSVYYSGVNLIRKIIETPGQEIGTHTFSHYYCLEDGQNLNTFKSDIKKAIAQAKTFNIEISSIIFPRNQYNGDYLQACFKEGIRAYRGNEDNFIQKPRSQKKLNILIRLFRFADTYVNITGNNIMNKIEIDTSGLVNISASFFFRPYKGKGGFIEYLKLRRYKMAMLAAAKNGGLIHLWWHPHNFGKDQEKNLFQLKEILEYYKYLNKKYKMRSLNMREIVDEANK